MANGCMDTSASWTTATWRAASFVKLGPGLKVGSWWDARLLHNGSHLLRFGVTTTPCCHEKLDIWNKLLNQISIITWGYISVFSTLVQIWNHFRLSNMQQVQVYLLKWITILCLPVYLARQGKATLFIQHFSYTRQTQSAGWYWMRKVVLQYLNANC